jgi:hypothetical protein
MLTSNQAQKAWRRASENAARPPRGEPGSRTHGSAEGFIVWTPPCALPACFPFGGLMRMAGGSLRAASWDRTWGLIAQHGYRRRASPDAAALPRYPVRTGVPVRAMGGSVGEVEREGIRLSETTAGEQPP